MPSTDTDRLTQGFAVFNCHVNDASARADAEVIAQFGQAEFDRYISPCHEDGIMSILHADAPCTLAWVVLVTAFVNEEG